MKNIFNFLLLLVFFSADLVAQDIQLMDGKTLKCTDVKSQGNTGTCWSFSTISFLESEVLRMGFDEIDFSEMYIVRHIYFDKAMNYYLRQGKANFSQGSLSHDVINVIAKHGIVPDKSYPGRKGKESYNHTDLEKELKEFLDSEISSKDKTPFWMIQVNKILDKHLGALPREVDANAFSSYYGLSPDNYVSFTSFKHHPVYTSFILEIPDNYSNGSYLNVELGDLRTIVDYALDKGYTVSWDGDVSESGFRAKEGFAVLSNTSDSTIPQDYKETRVNAGLRQDEFMTYKTTDDHLMHIVGKVEDSMGRKYYKVKNSWGELGPFEGYLYMSEAYFDMKTVGVLVHKMAVPPAIQNRF